MITTYIRLATKKKKKNPFLICPNYDSKEFHKRRYPRVGEEAGKYGRVGRRNNGDFSDFAPKFPSLFFLAQLHAPHKLYIK